MPSVGAVTSNLNVVTKTAVYTAVANDFVIADATSAAFIVTLPTAPTLNSVVSIKKSDTTTNLVTVVPGGTAKIDNDTSLGLYIQGATAQFQYDGTNWQVQSTALTNAGMTSPASSGGLADTMLSASPYTVGYWYDRRNGQPGSGQLGAGGILNTSTIYYVPFYAFGAFKLDQIALVTGATAPSSSSVRVGLYKAGAGNAPGAFVADFGLLSLGATANTLYTSSIFSAVSVASGWNYFALSFNSASPGNPYGVYYGTAVAPNQGLPGAQLTAAAVQTGTLPPGALYYTGIGNASASALVTAVPATTPAYVNSNTQASGLTLYGPNVWYRIAA